MKKLKQLFSNIKKALKRIAKAWRVLLNKKMCETCEGCSCNT